MKKIKYKMSARTTILLGRESVSKVDGAIIELIKNTYDADAANCFISFDTINDKIYIIDDGTGMTQDIIENYWMMIGTDNKKNNYKSSKNRIKSGEKGIGRFALDRLGSKCEMYTKTKDSNHTLHWLNDWANFEQEGKALDEVEAELELIDRGLLDCLPADLTIIINEKTECFQNGTILIVSNLRDTWNEKDVIKVINTLKTLLPPIEQKDFHLYVKEKKDMDFVEVENTYQEDFDYKVEAEFDGDNFKVTIDRNEFDLKQIPKSLFEHERFKIFPYRYEDFEKRIYTKNYSIEELMKTNNKELVSNVKSIGIFKFNYVFMKLNLQEDSTEKFYYKNLGKGRNEWLANHNGIKIYRDNFMVRPYGDINSDSHDWLGLDARRSKDPAGIGHKRESWHVRNKQGQGTLFISRVYNGAILDKSSREGIIENDTFLLLKQVIIAIINCFEKDRAYIGRTMKIYLDSINQKEIKKGYGEEIAEKVFKSDNNENILLTSNEQRVLAETVSILNTEKEELISEIKLLRSLATNGLITTSIAHDLKTLQGSLSSRADLLKQAIDMNNNKYIIKGIADLKKSDIFLKSWISILTNQRKDKRTRKKQNIISTCKNIFSLLEPILLSKKIEVSFDSQEISIEKKIFENDLESIIYNLIINSIDIFEMKKIANRKINFKIQQDEEKIYMIYKDSGPGLDSIFYKNPYEIFNYGVTTKRDIETGKEIGTGLGMYIVDSTVREYNGDIVLLNYINNFELEIVIPK